MYMDQCKRWLYYRPDTWHRNVVPYHPKVYSSHGSLYVLPPTSFGQCLTLS